MRDDGLIQGASQSQVTVKRADAGAHVRGSREGDSLACRKDERASAAGGALLPGTTPCRGPSGPGAAGTAPARRPTDEVVGATTAAAAATGAAFAGDPG